MRTARAQARRRARANANVNLAERLVAASFAARGERILRLRHAALMRILRGDRALWLALRDRAERYPLCDPSCDVDSMHRVGARCVDWPGRRLVSRVARSRAPAPTPTRASESVQQTQARAFRRARHARFVPRNDVFDTSQGEPALASAIANFAPS
jgi:hypothetical protein